MRLLATPGHTPQDITTLVGTADDVVAPTHLWWSARGPADDPYATNRERAAAAAEEDPCGRHSDRPRARRTIPSGFFDAPVTARPNDKTRLSTKLTKTADVGATSSRHGVGDRPSAPDSTASRQACAQYRRKPASYWDIRSASLGAPRQKVMGRAFGVKTVRQVK